MSLHELGIAELAPLLASGTLSPLELTDHYLARIDQYDAQLNTYVRVLPDQARAAARAAEAEIGRGEYRGPLHGVPLGLKDLFEVAGSPSAMGSRILADAPPASADATVVARLRDSGAVLLGKHT